MPEALEAVGVREAKNRSSELTALVNQTGAELVVLKNSRPWVVIQPADAAAEDRRTRLDRLRALTSRIGKDAANEPEWGSAVSDFTCPVFGCAFSFESRTWRAESSELPQGSLVPRPSSRATRPGTGDRAFPRWTRGRTARSGVGPS